PSTTLTDPSRSSFSISMLPPPPRSPLFPYTTLFRSAAAVGRARLCLTRPRGGAGGAAARNRGRQSRSRSVSPVPRRDPEPEPARRRALPARRPGVRAAPRAVARRPGARETGGGDGSGSGRSSRRSDPPIGICVRARGAERVPAPVSLLRRNAPRGAEGELLPPV